MTPVPDTTLRATPPQLRNLMIAALASLALTVALACLSGGGAAVVAFAVVFAVVALVLVPIWLFYLAAYVRLDDIGITSRLFVRRSCDWRNIEDIRVREQVSASRVRSYTVRVRPRNGPEFTLAMPVDGGIMPDKDFRARVGLVEQAWRLRGGREIAVIR
jgi:hypothetical protein